VDDNEPSRTALARLLRHAGFAVLEVDNGAEALRLMGLDPDLVILDVFLPDIGGCEVCRRIRAEPATAHTPVLMVSGIAVDCDGRVHGLESGADAYLPKPIDPGELVAYAKALLRVRHAEEALRDSERRLRGIIEKSLDAVLLIGQDGTITYASPSGARVLGYAPDELVGLNGFDLLHPEDRPEVEELFAQLLQSAGRTAAATYRARHQGGSWHWLEALYTNRLGKLGVEAIMCNFRDVTEQRRPESQSQQSHQLEAVGRLAGGVAHDFNNLLTVINGYSDLLRQTLPPGDRAREMATEVHRAGAMAASLTQQLLSVSRPRPPDPQPLDLNAVVADMEKMLRRVIGEDVELATALQPDLLTAIADPSEVEQVLLNLAVNARDAMPRGGRLTIETHNTPEGEASAGPGGRAGPQVVLAVRDTGEGMTEEVQARIFEPYFTTKQPGRGTGLGLATVFGIVERLGGRIDVESAPGRGTTFRIVLPAQLDIPWRAEPDAGARPVALGAETVLLVEDDDAICDFAGRVLRDGGYTVLAAGNGAEALALVGRYPEPIHLVVTDVVMPMMGGHELADRLRAVRPEAKVLFFSGYRGEALARHGVREDRVEFLQKPFTSAELAHKVRTVLEADVPSLESTGHRDPDEPRLYICRR
jgi:PAS domain S-box-containing protein